MKTDSPFSIRSFTSVKSISLTSTISISRFSLFIKKNSWNTRFCSFDLVGLLFNTVLFTSYRLSRQFPFLGQYFFMWLSIILYIGSMVSLFKKYIRTFPFLSTKIKPHLVKGFRLWEIMLCSWLRASASWVTFLGDSLRSSSIPSRVGFESVEKNKWQVSLRSYFT